MNFHLGKYSDPSSLAFYPMWHSYLINLEKNKARLENSRCQFAAEGIAFTPIQAVNGWALEDVRIAEVYDARAASRRYKYQMVKPEIGCYLSHIGAWRTIVESGTEGGFVFEDDFEIVSPLALILEELSLPPGDGTGHWDIVKLFSLSERPKIIRSKRLTHTHDLVVPYQVPTCLLGYGIRVEAAKRLLETSIPFFRPVDEDHKFFWEKNLAVSLVHPSPIKVGDQQTETGTIGNVRKSHNRNSITARIARSFKSVSYQLSYKTRLHYYRNIGQRLP